LRRTLFGLLGLVPLLGFLGFGVLLLTVAPDNQTLRIPGLSAAVDITLDGNGVPRIRAANETDAATALGYIHARDRMFQMELMRRAASGRLSELVGPATLPIDKQMRVLGLGRLAEGDLAAQSPETRALLVAYARGVNAWIANRGRFAALEFLFLGPPEPWRPSDSLLWGRTMGLWLSTNYRNELVRQSLRDKVPKQTLEQLWAPPPAPLPPQASAGAPRYADDIMLRPPPDLALRHPPASPGIPRLDRGTGGPGDQSTNIPGATDGPVEPPIKSGAGHDGEGPDALLAALPAFPAPFTLPSTASDAWAVDGRWSETGAPLLAGDPHLSFDFPGLWYLVRVETPGHVLAGATAPGVPFLVLGRNSKIAWTFTTTGADTQDVYLEPPDATFTARQERIKVRGQPDVLLTVRETRHGPVISDLSGAAANGPAMAVAMANLRPRDTAATGLLALDHADSVEEAGKAAALISSPVQNLMVADHGKIGLFVTGLVPIRRAGDGWAPVPGITRAPTADEPRAEVAQTEPPEAQGATQAADGGSQRNATSGSGDDAYGWSGFASGDALPHIVAPSSGRLVNGNEPVWPPDFPVFMGRDTFRDWRARRIRALLDSAPVHSTSDFAAMQTDVVSTYAAALLPTLRVVPGAPQVLRDWDGAMAENDPRPLIFSAWMDAFHRAVLARAGLTVAASAPVFEFVPFVLSPAGASWCGGDCAPLLKSTLDSTMSSLAERFGPDPSSWRWGTVHQAVFAHPLLRSVPVLGALTTLRIAVPGDGTTLDRGGTNEALEAVHGASFRGVYDLADLDRSLFMMAPGQSGNPLSRHARDFLTRWRDGAMILLASKPVETSGVIRLEP
jgi:penicillin amidase